MSFGNNKNKNKGKLVITLPWIPTLFKSRGLKILKIRINYAPLSLEKGENSRESY